jgi:hypothetical protein
MKKKLSLSLHVKLPRLNKASKKHLRAVILFGAISAVAILFISNAVIVDLTPAAFQPTKVNSRTFDVSSGANHAGQLGNDLVYSYLDSNGQYPGVSIFQSDSYFSDSQGNQITNLSSGEILATEQRLVMGNQVYFVHEYYQTIQIGARTRWNTHEIGDTTSKVSPLTSAVGTWDNRHYELAYNGQNHVSVEGDLVMWDMHNNIGQWYDDHGPMTVSGTKGTISSSIVPIYFPNIQTMAPAGAFNPSSAASYIKNSFGNREIYIYPQINIHGVSNYISYKGFSYNLTLSNGTTIQVSITTEGANVGFTEVRKTGFDITGTVPATNPMGVNPRTYMESGSITSKQGHQTETPDDAKKDAGGDSSTAGYELTGYIHPRPDLAYIDPSTYYSDVMGYSTSLDGKSTQVVLDDTEHNCGMDQDLLITPELRLKPFTEIYWTGADVRWEYLLRVSSVNTYTPVWDNHNSGTAQVYWPYGVDVTNMYAIAQFTYTVTAVTRNDISMVTSNGSPVDVAKAIRDFGSAAIIKNPNTDLADVSITVPPAPNLLDMLLGWLGSLFGNLAGILILVGIVAVVIVVLYLVITFRKKR